MSPVIDARVGEHPLTRVDRLPNVTVAFPGEHWSNRYASGAITPGVAVVPATSAGRLYMKTAGAGDSALQLAIALRTVDIPDPNNGPASGGPNEVRNQDIAHGEYVHAYYSGVFLLTLVAPDAYAPGDLIGWDANGARPTGKSGAGSWAKNSAADIDSIFEVMEFRPFSADGHEGIVTARSLRGQF